MSKFRAFVYMMPIALSACGTERPRIVRPPVELTTCAGEPAVPVLPERDGTDAGQLVRDRLTLDFILALRSAYGDCRSKVDGLRAWSEALD